MSEATYEQPQSRFSFPFPTSTMEDLRKAIVWLMSDGKRRSVREIQDALGTQREIGARIRELRNGAFGTAWPFTNARSEGPDPDGAFCYRLRIEDLPYEQGMQVRR